jgi:hypothetical protein
MSSKLSELKSEERRPHQVIASPAGLPALGVSTGFVKRFSSSMTLGKSGG